MANRGETLFNAARKAIRNSDLVLVGELLNYTPDSLHVTYDNEGKVFILAPEEPIANWYTGTQLRRLYEALQIPEMNSATVGVGMFQGTTVEGSINCFSLGSKSYGETIEGYSDLSDPVEYLEFLEREARTPMINSNSRRNATFRVYPDNRYARQIFNYEAMRGRRGFHQSRLLDFLTHSMTQEQIEAYLQREQYLTFLPAVPEFSSGKTGR